MYRQLCLLAAFCAAAPLGAQSPCQPLQGTAAHASCLNERLGRSADPDLRALEDQAAGRAFIAPDLNLSRRDGPPVPAYNPGFAASVAQGTRRLEQSTRSRAQALSGRVNRSLYPRTGTPGR